MEQLITSSEASAAANGVKNLNLKDDDGGSSEQEQRERNNDEDENATNDDDEIKSTGSGDSSTLIASEDDDDDTSGVASSADEVEKLLIEAINMKEEGNNHFKLDELDKAAISYRRGVNSIKKLNKNNTGRDQVKGLLVTLQTNFSMVRFKQGKYKVSAELAGKAIYIEPNNVKALYRRSLAYRKMGDLEKAKVDLRAALQVEANNLACKRELAAIKKELEQARESQKKALAKAFSSKNGSFLYTDKEEEEKRKEEEAKQKKKEEQELYKKRKAAWEDECVKRMSNNEKVESFEEWETRRKNDEESLKKIEEKKRKEEEKKRKDLEKKAKKAARDRQKSNESDSDYDDLTEKELAMMRGYKKTADGRTTSYFTREISDEEKRRQGSIAPQRLSESPMNLSETNASRELSSSSQQPGPSAWNQAQTWEEKDTTEWCKKQLRTRLEATSIVSDTMDCDITSVDELTGDASVAMAGGKKRYIFDFHVVMKFEIKDSKDNKLVVGSGIVRIPDISSVSHDELEVTFDGWKECPSTDCIDKAMKLRSLFVTELRKSVQDWVQDFNNQY
jgi:Activator of Hsp90 ATPase, N-terminal/Tetratricopeptide repeat